jgi:uncharacterized membrane protein
MTGHVRFTSLDIAAFGSWIIVGFIDAVSQAMGGFFLGTVLVILRIGYGQCQAIMGAHDC